MPPEVTTKKDAKAVVQGRSQSMRSMAELIAAIWVKVETLPVQWGMMVTLPAQNLMTKAPAIVRISRDRERTTK